jgi:predicted GNAT family N-acyltransferase
MRLSQYIKLENPIGLACLDTTEYYGEGYIITRINVPVQHRGKGLGSDLLRKCCKVADEHNIDLWLEIMASDGPAHDDLEAWYLRHGFKNLGSIYHRKPNK